MARNFGLSFMTVFVLILMLLSLNTLWSIDILTNESLGLVKNQVNMSLYLAAAADDKQIASLEKYLKSFPEVTNLTTESKEKVLADFKTRYQLKTDVLAALQELGTNPFGPTITITTKEPSDYKKIIDNLNIPEYNDLIESKSFDEHSDAIDHIQAITNRIEKVGLGVSLLFAGIAFLIIFNTVRVAIYTQRVEIGIKRLVGANNWFIRGPYLVTAIIFSAVSVIVSAAIVFGILRFVDPYVSVVFSNGFTLTKYYQSHTLYLFGTQTALVLVLTMISSTLAMRRQLKV